jgi:hypothetical protein
MHWDVLSAGFVYEASNRVEGSVPSDGMPFVFGEAIIIIGVDDGELSLSKRYSAEGIAIAEEAVEKERQN